MSAVNAVLFIAVTFVALALACAIADGFHKLSEARKLSVSEAVPAPSPTRLPGLPLQSRSLPARGRVDVEGGRGLSDDHDLAIVDTYMSGGEQRWEFWCSCGRFHMTGLNAYEAIGPVLVAHREIERSLAPFNEVL